MYVTDFREFRECINITSKLISQSHVDLKRITFQNYCHPNRLQAQRKLKTRGAVVI